MQTVPVPAGWRITEHGPVHYGMGGKCWCETGHPHGVVVVEPWPGYWDEYGDTYWRRTEAGVAIFSEARMLADLSD